MLAETAAVPIRKARRLRFDTKGSCNWRVLNALRVAPNAAPF
jgi:hypothetical protein